MTLVTEKLKKWNAEAPQWMPNQWEWAGGGWRFRSGPDDAKHLLEFGREFGHGGGDLGRLLEERSHHALSHLGFMANELGRGHDQGKIIVDVVPQRRKLVVQFLDLF